MKDFKTNDVLIRKFKEDDIDTIYESLNSSNNKVSNLSNLYVNQSKFETQKMLESAMFEYNTEEPVWALEKKQTKDVFGFIKVDKYSPKNKICNISWAMIDSNINEILIANALKRVIDYLFEKRGIELIECSYYEENKKTGEILDNIGMKKEAVLKHRRINDETKEKEDFVIYSITMNEFLSTSQRKN